MSIRLVAIHHSIKKNALKTNHATQLLYASIFEANIIQAFLSLCLQKDAHFDAIYVRYATLDLFLSSSWSRSVLRSLGDRLFARLSKHLNTRLKSRNMLKIYVRQHR